MKFSCDQCNAQYMIADEKVGTRGVKVKCKKCSHVIVVKPAAAQIERQDTEVVAPNADVGAFNEATQAMSAAQLASLKAEAASGEGVFAPEPAAAPAFSPSLFADPFSAMATQADAPQATLPPVSMPESEMSAPDPGDGGFSGFTAPPTEGRPSGEFNLDQALGTSQAAAPALLPSDRPAGEKEWYVAIEDAQIGPVDLREIEQRWDSKELSEDSLAWRAGMGDWMPVAEISELAYLVTERPQPKPQAAPAFAGMPTASSSLPQPVGPVAFAGSNVEISGVSWKPSAASALSSLVQEELVATAKPAESPAASGPSPTEMGMPSFGATDLFGKGGNGGIGAPAVPAAAPSFAPVMADPFAASANWSVPKPVQSSGIKPMTLMLVVMGLVVVGLVAVVAVILLRPPAVSQGGPSAPVAAVTPLPAGTQGSAVSPGGATPPAVDDAKPASASTSTTDAGAKTAKTKPGVKTKTKGDGEDKPTGTKTKGKDPLGDLFDEGKKPAAAANLAATPSKEQVVSGVKSNVKAIVPCLQAAKAKGELAAGKHTLVLDFVIKPNGSVSDGQLKGPAYVMGTSMPGCFAQKMKSWTFPPSKNGIPVKNYPLPFGM